MTVKKITALILATLMGLTILLADTVSGAEEDPGISLVTEIPEEDMLTADGTEDFGDTYQGEDPPLLSETRDPDYVPVGDELTADWTDGSSISKGYTGETDDGKFTVKVTDTDKKYVGIIQKNGGKYTGDATIPSTVKLGGENYTVTSIEEYAFFCSEITGELKIPNTVTRIEGEAFGNCSGLTGDLTIPAGVTSIDNSAFGTCRNINGKLTIPDSVTFIRDAFLDNNFTAVTNASNITIPCDKIIAHSGISYRDSATGEIVDTIGKGTYIMDSYLSAFEYEANADGTLILKKTNIPKQNVVYNPMGLYMPSKWNGHSVTAIGESAFADYTGFIGDLTIPDSVTSIGAKAFENCSGLTGDLTIPDSVTIIEDGAFLGCSGLTGDLTIPNSVTDIGNSAFYNCSGLTGELTLSNSVTIIKDGAFSDCSGLTGDLTIPAGVTSIGTGAFSNCSGLTGDLTIPVSVTRMRKGAFIRTKFTSIRYGGTLAQWEAITGIAESGLNGGNVIPEWVSSPEFTPKEGIYTSAQDVTINCTTEGAKIYYTLDGSDPTTARTMFSVPIHISADTTIKAIVVKDGSVVSDVASATYTINEPEPEQTYRVKATTDGNGTATANPASGVSGTKVTIKATPADGYDFKEWKVVSGGVTLADKTKATTTFDTGTADVEVKATFTKKAEPTPGPEPKPGPTPTPTPEPTPTPGPEPTPSKLSIKDAAVKLSKTSFKYNGKVQTPSVTVKLNGKTLSADRDYNISWSNSKSKAVGKYTVTITGKGNYTDQRTVEYKIVKSKNPLTVKVGKKSLNVPYSKLKKDNRTIKLSKYLKVSKAQGKVTYSKSKGNKKITIDKKTGKITVGKGLKKGTYSVTISVKAAGNKNYNSTTQKATVKIVVK